MNRRLLLLIPLLAAAAPGLPGGAAGGAAPEAVPWTLRYTPPGAWARDLGAPGRILLAADLNGDGYDDVVSIQPAGTGHVDVAMNGRGWKSLPPRRVLAQVGAGCVAAAVVESASGEPEIVTLHSDRRLRSARALLGRVERVDLGALPGRGPLAGWVHARRESESLRVWVVEREGGILGAEGAAPRERLRWGSRKTLAGGAPVRVSFVRAGGWTEVLWTDERGRVRRAGLAAPSGPDREAGLDDGQVHARARLGSLGGAADLRALLGASSLVPADMNGDGRIDFLRPRRDGDRHGDGDLLVQLAYAPGQPDADGDGLDAAAEAAAGSDPLRRDTDLDGLLDGWEVLGWAGEDLAALGCRPGRKDLLVRLQRVEDMDEGKARGEMHRAAAYYAGLPVRNPDGSTGIHLVVRYDPAVPKPLAARPWWEVADRQFASRLRGSWHWKLVYSGGGGQADMLADRGSAGGAALYATFIHEMGHQLGLPHEGFWPGGWCPAYPSLMNYAYSYQLGGRGEAIGYSTGRLARLTFDERSLSERLPMRMEDVQFLAGPPYRWRLKGEGETTLVDWNWNGVFGEERVRADINYGYSTTAGRRQILMPPGQLDAQDRTGHAPFALTLKGRLLLFYVAAPRDAKADERMTEEERRTAAPIPGRVRLRIHQGGETWSPPVEVTDEEATGDPYAVAHGGRTWLFYPTASGLRARPLQGSGRPAGEAVSLPNSAGAAVSGISWGRRLLLFLWRGGGTALTMAEWTQRGLGPEQEMPFRSTVPVAPCRDERTGELLLGCAEDQDAARRSRYRVRRFVLRDGAAPEPKGERWVMGEAGTASGNRRPVLLFEGGGHAGPEGRLHFLGLGMVEGGRRKSCYFNWMTVADRTVNDGWLQRRYYDEWTESASAIAACWYRGDIFLASRWYGVANREFRDNGLYVAYSGLGIQAEPMGDHDDVGFIGGRGLHQSILYLAPGLDVGALPHGPLRRAD